MTQKSLLETDISVINLQLQLIEKTPFLGILMMTPLVQSSEIFSRYHISVKSGSRVSATKLGSALHNSALRSSKPGAFPFFNALMAEMTSCLDCRLVLISKSAVAP